jgi:hypothetical protein
MTEDEKTDLWCIGRVNGLGEKCADGSYVGLIYSGGGTRTHIRISTGHADNLIAEIQAALKEPPEKPKPFPPGTKISTTPPVQ